MSTALAIDPVRRPSGPVPWGPPLHAVGPRVDPVPEARPAPQVRPQADARPQPALRPKVLAGAVVLTGVVAVVAAQLLLSIGTADSAYRLAALRSQSDLLARQQQVRTEELRDLAAPQRLAARAASLGLVPDETPAYLDARSGRVLGSTAAATRDATHQGGLLH